MGGGAMTIGKTMFGFRTSADGTVLTMLDALVTSDELGTTLSLHDPEADVQLTVALEGIERMAREERRANGKGKRK